jgi:AcrR family transcriptional regulator
MVEEIKQTARRHLAAEGAPNLSLRAVAREVGLVSSAIYRYYPSRDDLLTALILDAYNALGDAVEQADAGVERSDIPGRFDAACQAVRTWALANPHEYALTYGSPVPGYAAPMDTVGPANRPVVVLMRIVSDGVSAGVIRRPVADWLPLSVHTEVERIGIAMMPGIPVTILARGMVAWTELFGAVSFEVFGRLRNVFEDTEAWFGHQVLTMARLVGVRP